MRRQTTNLVMSQSRFPYVGGHNILRCELSYSYTFGQLFNTIDGNNGIVVNTRCLVKIWLQSSVPNLPLTLHYHQPGRLFSILHKRHTTCSL